MCSEPCKMGDALQPPDSGSSLAALRCGMRWSGLAGQGHVSEDEEREFFRRARALNIRVSPYFRRSKPKTGAGAE